MLFLRNMHRYAFICIYAFIRSLVINAAILASKKLRLHGSAEQWERREEKYSRGATRFTGCVAFDCRWIVLIFLEKGDEISREWCKVQANNMRCGLLKEWSDFFDTEKRGFSSYNKYCVFILRPIVTICGINICDVNQKEDLTIYSIVIWNSIFLLGTLY